MQQCGEPCRGEDARSSRSSAHHRCDSPTDAKVRLVSLTTFPSIDPVPVIELAATDDAAAANAAGSLQLNGSKFERMLLIVKGPSGTVESYGANVGRAHYGSGWSDP